VFENRVLRRIFGAKKKAVTIVMEESIYMKRSTFTFHIFYRLPQWYRVFLGKLIATHLVKNPHIMEPKSLFMS